MANTVHDALTAVIDSHKSRRLMPALDLANQIVALTDPQIDALDALLKQIQEHPRITRSESLLQMAERRINRG